MHKAALHLIRTTWLDSRQPFAIADETSGLDWDALADAVECGEYTEHETTVIDVLAILDGQASPVTLQQINSLPDDDKQAVVESLRLAWTKAEILQEDL